MNRERTEDQYDPVRESTTHTLCWEREYDVPADRLFDAVADRQLYVQLAPNLSAMEIISGRGVGMVRQCTNPEGASWMETYTEWVEGERFATRVEVATYPPDLREMIEGLEASWTVKPISATSSKVIFQIDAELTELGEAVLVAGGGADALVEPILKGWAAHLA